MKSDSNWLKTWLLPAAVMAMESTWLYILMRAAMLGQQSGPAALLPYPLVAGTMACGFLSARWVFDQNWSEIAQRAMLGATGVLIALLTVRINYHGLGGLLSSSVPVTLVSYAGNLLSHPSVELVAMVASGVLWWRGMRCSDPTLDGGEVNRLFRIGLLALGFGLLFCTLVLVVQEERVQTASLLLPAISFFVFGLLALSAGHLADLRANAAHRGTGGPASGNFWFMLLFGAASAVVLPGLLLSELLTPEALQSLLRPMSLVWDALSYLIVLTAYPFALLAEIVFRLFKWLAAGHMPTQAQEAADEMQTNFEDLLASAGRGEPSPLLTVIKVVCVASVVILLVWILVRIISQRHKEQVDDGVTAEERESVFSWEFFLAQLRAAFDAWIRRVRGYRPPFVGHQESVGPVAIPENESSLSVRQIYVALLGLADSLGLARRPDQTPYEYLRNLQAGYAAEREELADLTEAYVRVRYGEETITQGELERLRNVWRQVRDYMRARASPSGDTRT